MTCVTDVEGEGLAETEWLVAAGLGQLREPFLEGKEVSDTELNATLSILSPHQAQAIKRRVDTLNFTIRQRARQNRARHRKPDIRDVFRDYEASLLIHLTSIVIPIIVLGKNITEG